MTEILHLKIGRSRNGECAKWCNKSPIRVPSTMVVASLEKATCINCLKRLKSYFRAGSKYRLVVHHRIKLLQKSQCPTL